jgi:hypothetical protein
MNYLEQQLSASAADFQNIVWPEIRRVPLISGGTIRPVEAVTAGQFAQELDLLAGIDAWQKLEQPIPALRGIASRVQWGGQYDSFTIRLTSRFGAPTEFDKRLYAVQNRDSGVLFPHITVQAYLLEPGSTLLSAAAITTERLISRAKILVENRARLQLRDELYGFRDNADGTSFLYMKWNYLIHVGELDPADIWKLDYSQLMDEMNQHML